MKMEKSTLKTNNNKPWSKEEIKFMNDNRTKYNVVSLSQRFNRSYYAVQSKLAEVDKYGYEVIYNKAKAHAEIEKNVTKSKSIKTKSKSQTKIKTDNKKSFSLFWGLFKWN